ncbi:endonuclease/exonuclease/phosphatase family protein [Mycolicibacterium mengxianglii]|uniref:endonuclease/exonuclease/phosphatase family protein n=1 Tax=Mycolicibacterium mengxianglii TaxID=2736649 RepID=UPI0018D0B413|nr:endonuclease/exonuclease/phosphatase family protein [Mycolicibacterium mengxianglii]
MTRRPRLTVALLAAAATLFCVLALTLRARPITNLVSLIVAVGSPFVPLLALTGLALAVVSRRVWLSVAAVAVAVTTVAVQVDWYYIDSAADAAQHTDVRMLSSNLRLGQADPSTLVGLAEDKADVIAVSELTTGAIERFEDAGIDEAFPHSMLIPRPGAGGIGLWSRYPLVAVRSGKPQNYAIAAARLQIPGARFDPLVASVHVGSPVASDRDAVTEWRIGLAAIKTAMTAFAVGAEPAAVIIAGDFNSTPDERQFRDLLTNGYRDAVEQTGAGFSPTFPSRTWHPPLLTIDHVLTRNAAASSIRTVYIPGSDHRALLATIQVPLGPTAS